MFILYAFCFLLFVMQDFFVIETIFPILATYFVIDCFVDTSFILSKAR